VQGHKRRDGRNICPSDDSGTLPSPPASPGRSLLPLPVGPFRPAAIPDIVIPSDGRRQNPNWVEPPDPNLAPAIPPPPASVSDDSTELVDDGASIKSFDDDDNTTSSDNTEDDFLIQNALATSLPLASVFSTPKEAISDIRKVARDIGLHTSLMRRPTPRNAPTYNQFGQPIPSWWVVLGRDKEAVKHLAEVQKGGMPGFFVPERDDSVNEGRPSSTGSSSSLGFFQLVLAGAIGGAAVLFGAAKML